MHKIQDTDFPVLFGFRVLKETDGSAQRTELNPVQQHRWQVANLTHALVAEWKQKSCSQTPKTWREELHRKETLHMGVMFWFSFRVCISVGVLADKQLHIAKQQTGMMKVLLAMTYFFAHSS